MIEFGRKINLQMKMIIIYNLIMNSYIGNLTSSAPDAPILNSSTSVVSPRASGASRLSSDTIFGGAVEVEIEHNGMLYRLRKTSLGKLILTK